LKQALAGRHQGIGLAYKEKIFTFTHVIKKSILA
jgi:hypothetical protein